MLRQTTDGMFELSFSPGTATDWTRNLSRHFASGGGSSFIACNRTAGLVNIITIGCMIFLTLNLYLRTWINATRVWSYAVPRRWRLFKQRQPWSPDSPTYCFGAVVLTYHSCQHDNELSLLSLRGKLTLKATGSLCGLRSRRIWETS